MEKFFAILGKIVLVILLFGGVAYGSYYMGQKGKTENKVVNYQNSKNSNTQVTVTETLTPSPTLTQLKTVMGGVDKKAGLSFSEYSLQVPDGWVETRESQTPSDEKLILTNGDYKISIFQAATGGAMCLYPEDPDFEGPSSKYTVFQNLSTKDGLSLRRSGTNTVNKNNQIGFTMCQKSSDGNFGQPTNYGHISLILPKVHSQTILLEMDQIISSLNKIS